MPNAHVGVSLSFIIGHSVFDIHPVRVLQSPGLGEGLEAAVVSLFDIVREAAAWQLSGREMIAQAVAAGSFSGAAGIGATAVIEILVFLAFHVVPHH